MDLPKYLWSVFLCFDGLLMLILENVKKLMLIGKTKTQRKLSFGIR